MPRYVSPGRTPSPSRSPSRSSRGGYTYTDGVYTPTNSDSYSPSPPRSRSRRQRGRSTSRTDSYYSRSPSRSRSRSFSRSRSRSRSTARTSGARSRLSSVLDTSSSTGKEKAENVVKTSLVMLGAIGAASLAAHKFWPKGVTYGEKEDWEIEKEKKKGKEKQEIREKLREGKDAVAGRRDDDRAAAGGSGGSSSDRARDPSRERRERYLQERLQERRRERLPLPAAVSGEPGAPYWENRDRRRSRRRYEDEYVEYDRLPRDEPRVRRYSAADLPPQRRPSQRRLEAPVPPPPAPNPPGHYADELLPPAPPLVVPAITGRRDPRDRGREVKGGYYVDGSTIVLPSSSEREYVVRREAPPGQRLRVRDGERDDAYYR